MRTLSNIESSLAAGGIWCTYDGEECSGCANLIEISGTDCSILKGQLNSHTGNIDTGSITMALAGGWASAVLSTGAGYAFGLGAIASGGIGLLLGVTISIGYTLSH